MGHDLSHTYQIGEVAESVGLSLRTIRHYEEVGLVPPSGRTAGGFRLYTDGDVERLRLVKHMKPLGFTLGEMRELLETKDRLAIADDGDRHDLLVRLGVFAAAAAERCAQLHEQLQQAESFARSLQRAGARRRQPTTAR